ncbi:TonB-dependent receptor [Zhongshania sp.]|uniref:TonB-dependent receptor n=1 Tax=Zhongshania sp. TaxID=1971902 RepID=UPI003565F7C0
MSNFVCRASALAIAFALNSYGAQAANDLALEEILVTAEKRETSLQDTPISILAFSSERLERFGISDLGDIAGLAPNVTITPFPNSRSSLVVFMRGVGNNDSQSTQDPAVGIYLDGVYVARSIGLTSDVADLERIEVLRGPQGTLYGRNTTGGAINLITAKPIDDFAVSQQFSAGNRGYWRSLSKIESGKVGDFAGKISYLESGHDGWVENTGAGKNFGEEEKQAGRAAVRWDLSDALAIDYAYDFSNIDGPQHFYQVTSSPGNALPNTSAERSDSGSWNGGVEPSATEVSGHSLIASLDTPWGVLKSISGYRELAEDIVQDYGGGSPGFKIRVGIEQDQFSQEFQFVGEHGEAWRYVAGIYYFKEHGTEKETDTVPVQTPAPLPANPLVPPSVTTVTLEDRQIYSTSEAYAAYGQLTWSPALLDHRLDVTLGGRYTADERAARKDSAVYFTGGEQSDSATWSNFNPSLTLDYSWTEELSTFAKVVTAYKSGGYNVRSTEDGFTPPFDEEHMVSYELGVKSSWFNNRISVNASAFRAEYEDMQLQQITNNATIFLTDVFNVGEAQIDGFEVDVMAVLMRGLTMQVSYGYTDADFIEYIDQRGGSQTEGENLANQAEMPYAPEHNYTVGLEYMRAVGSASSPMMLNASIDYQWTDERYGTAFNDDMSGFFLDDYGLVNARLALSDISLGRLGLEVALWGRNLTDEEYKVHSISLGAYQAGYFGEQKSYGVDLRLSF